MANGKVRPEAIEYAYSTCGYKGCGRRFRRGRRPGRPRKYCQPACRRRAQRLRGTQGVSVPAVASGGQGVARRLHVLSGELVDAERRGRDLAELMARAMAVSVEAEHYARAAVRDARIRGESWEFIARSAHVSQATSMGKWARGSLAAETDRPAQESAGRGIASVRLVSSRSNRELLGCALSRLLGECGDRAGAAAEQAGVSASALSVFLTGERVPDWPVLFTLVTSAQRRPEEFRALWEWATGLRAPACRSAVSALSRFVGALRGLHLSAGCPDVLAIATTAAGHADEALAGAAEAVLHGDWVPDWGTTRLLIEQLGGQPEQFRLLWEDVQYTFFLARDFHPQAGADGAQHE